MLKFLLSKGADFNIKDDEMDSTPLTFAKYLGESKCARLLRKAGAK